MHSFIAIVGMAAAVAAQTPGFHAINLPGMMEKVPACTTYTIKWTPSNTPAFSGPVTFGLIGGASQQTLVPIGPNFGSAEGSAGQLAWDVPCDAGDKAIYGLKIFLASDLNTFQYSMPFQITPAEVSSTTTPGPVATGNSTEPVATGTMTDEPAVTATAEDEDCEEEDATHTADDEDCEETTTMATSHPVTTGPSNSTVTTHKPTMVTSFTTENTAAGTAPAQTSPVAAGASRAMSGSFAILAVAAAFFAL